MRNGVVLAKLGNFFAPQVITQNKIFDKSEQRYNETGLHFRHTDNIVQWMRACTSVGLPEVCHSLRDVLLEIHLLVAPRNFKE